MLQCKASEAEARVLIDDGHIDVIEGACGVVHEVVDDEVDLVRFFIDGRAHLQLALVSNDLERPVHLLNGVLLEIGGEDEGEELLYECGVRFLKIQDVDVLFHCCGDLVGNCVWFFSGHVAWGVLSAADGYL